MKVGRKRAKKARALRAEATDAGGRRPAGNAATADTAAAEQTNSLIMLLLYGG